MKAVIVKLK